MIVDFSNLETCTQIATNPLPASPDSIMCQLLLTLLLAQELTLLTMFAYSQIEFL
jgi:hypothetical protein